MATRVSRVRPDIADAGVAACLLLLVGAQAAPQRPDASLAAYLAFAPAITLPLARRAPGAGRWCSWCRSRCGRRR